MSKKFLSLALALALCLGLTVPAFADAAYDYTSTMYSEIGGEASVYYHNYSANGYTDPSAENVTFSVAPVGVAKIRWEGPWNASEYSVYVFDQDCVVTRKDGLPFNSFSLPSMYGDVGYSVGMGNEYWTHVEEEWSWVEAGAAGIRVGRDDGWAFQFSPDGEDWSPLMMSKKGLDTVFPFEDTENDTTGTVLEYRPLSTQPTVPTVGGFTDVKTGDYFADPVLWAVEKKITAGTSATTFAPNATCTQSQILTFLWRAKGEPKPTGTVSGTQYYATAAQWAKEQGLTDNFSAEADCTRAMVVTYLWKLAGSPKTGTSNFTDVSANADYAQAVAWAVEQGITSGTGNGQFSPASTCTRGQIVSFLYRAFAK